MMDRKLSPRARLAVILALVVGSWAMITGTLLLGAEFARADVVHLPADGPAYVNGAGTVCAEDEPCWTWSTMGNLSRGIVTTRGARIVVDPPRFARLARAHRIDWHATPHLRGDAWARAHGTDGRYYAQDAR